MASRSEGRSEGMAINIRMKFLLWTTPMLLMPAAVGLLPADAATSGASPAGTRGYHRLLSVSELTSNDAWAVGFHGSPRRATTRHWDGSAWTIVANPSLDGSALLDVEAMGHDNVWAVGYDAQGGLAEHWDGSSWSQVPLPQKGTHGALTSVKGASSNDVWAVGYADRGTAVITVTEHWDGQTWSIVHSPSRDGAGCYLQGVAAVSADDVWAVGESVADGVPQTLVEHWDGSRWAIVPTPDRRAELLDVSATSASDIWAVGQSGTSGDQGPYDTYALHWDGKRWTRLSTPNGDFAANSLDSISATSADDVWAVGGSGDYIFSPHHNLIEHWNGKRWSVVSSPSPGRGENLLTSVSAISPSEARAVGYSAGGFRHLKATNVYLEWDGNRWRLT